MAYTPKYFSPEELTCRCCGQGMDKLNENLLKGLDRLREAIGGPLNLSCAYRCPRHNAEIGGAKASQHTFGSAADCLLPDWLSFGEFAWYVNTYSGADGIGLYPDDEFIHIDFRSNGTEPGVYRWEE